jgi:hypothetical protein
MNTHGHERAVARAAANYDSQSPDEMTDEEEAIAEWLASCPVKLSGFAESDISRIINLDLAMRNV